MKIGIIVRKLNVLGGVQRHVLYLARNLKQRGHDVTIYTFIYDKNNTFSNLLDGIGVVELGHYPKYKNLLQSIFDENSVCKKLSMLIDDDTTILNPHDHVTYKVACYFKKRKPAVPSVWTMHDMPTKLFSYTRRLSLSGERSNFLKIFFYSAIDLIDANRFVKKQDRVVVLDFRDKEYVNKYFNKDALVVRNGIDIIKFPFAKKEPIVARSIKLLMNGIFFPHRRFEDGISALDILRQRNIDAHLDIFGEFSTDVEYYKNLKELVAKLGLTQKVTFHGKVEEKSLVKSYQDHDIFIFPNHLQSWGLAVFEAMASGTPVIVSRSSGAHEVLTHGENALIVQPKSPLEIADMIQKLSKDVVLYTKLQIHGRAFVENNMSWSLQASHMENIFKSVL